MSTSESPVTPPSDTAGSTRPAGEDISDEEAAAEVAEQTSSDLKAADVFKREHDGATTDEAIDKASADEIADN